MNIPIGNLTITNFCLQNRNHIKFGMELKKDESIYEFVTTKLITELMMSKESERIECGNSYIIEEASKPIGFIRIEKILNENSIIELRYAVHPEYRRLGYMGTSDENRFGYGQQILLECSNYLLSLSGIHSIELHIRKDNERSIGCAEKAKYKRIGENPEFYYYIYRISRENETYEN